jgi:hypothetical protein
MDLARHSRAQIWQGRAPPRPGKCPEEEARRGGTRPDQQRSALISFISPPFLPKSQLAAKESQSATNTPARDVLYWKLNQNV